MKIGIVGDLHLRDTLPYSEYVKDGRVKEKKLVINTLISSFDDCDSIVFIGDQLNSKNNSSKVIQEFIELLESFDDKKIYIIAGNHEKFGNGRSAIDFLKEVKGKNWVVVTDKVVVDGKITLCPYFTPSELGVDSLENGLMSVMEKIGSNDTLFVHHAISDTVTTSNISTNIFGEIVLPKKELEKKFKSIIGGHIHNPQNLGNVIVTGSVFPAEINEIEKFAWKLDCDSKKFEEIKLPVRPIYGIENPTEEQINKLPAKAIVKVTITDKKMKDKLELLIERLKKFDAYLLVEKYKVERKKNKAIKDDVNILEMSIEELLNMYAIQIKADPKKMIAGFNLIKE